MTRVEGRRITRVARVMGTAVSVHVHLAAGADASLAARAAGAADAAIGEVRRIDALCSTYRADSEVERLRSGDLDWADAHPLVHELAERCRQMEDATHGRVSAGWRGGFDPTGLAKGWAVERAVALELAPLLAVPGVVAVGMNAGGDMQLATAPGADWTWRIGITDPLAPGGLLAVVEVVDGAVATSGTVERGSHIVDPTTGRPALGAVAATVVADGLTEADAWATAAVVAGAADLSWIGEAGTRSGLVVAPDGTVRRWVGQAEVVTAEAVTAEAIAAR
ncbi:FAD:protein FMN transferase [Agrococcus carbonis]|uniref:FAD:protein FMN transferase n=1 Tax=Agrococcus carbonis TaxID=684552 RepID=A0A1H1T3S4_9MICO|nr:FAD:protein FMN transferase [Agrococcus carbonis]SDS54773.1 thiamine biosynthesis lipoprotein [Agrococcus carbonis]